MKLAQLWQSYFSVYLKGVGGTLYLSIVTIILASFFGLGLCLIRLGDKKIPRGIIAAYIWLIRGSPILLQLYFFWLVLPKILPFEISDQACVILALVFNSAAFLSEVFRGGIQSVDKGQVEASKSLGLSGGQIFTRIVFPQALKKILPSLGNEYIGILKASSLASIFFINELTTAYKTVQAASFQPLASLAIAGIFYLVLIALVSKGFELMERRLKRNE